MTEASNVVELRTEADRAKDYRERAKAKLEELCLIMGEARKDDMRIDFGISYDQFGRAVVANLAVVRVLA